MSDPDELRDEARDERRNEPRPAYEWEWFGNRWVKRFLGKDEETTAKKIIEDGACNS